jgi:hypothetical protein
MRARTRCICGYSAVGWASRHETRYYRCSSIDHKARGHCGIGKFRADQVEREVWKWVQNLMRDPERLLRGYKEAQQQLDQQHDTTRVQVALIDEQIASYSRALDEAIADKRAAKSNAAKERYAADVERYGRLVDELHEKRAALAAKLNEETITDDEIRTIVDFVLAMRAELDDVDAEADFTTQRRLIEALNLHITMKIGADGKKWIDIHWMLPADRGCISTEPVKLSTETAAVRDDPPAGAASARAGHSLRDLSRGHA